MDTIMMKGLMMVSNNNNKKEIFSELRFFNFRDNEIKIASLENKVDIMNELKTLKIIELNDFESFESYVNYDHFLIFKLNDEYYFCETELVPQLQKESMIKILDFNHQLRKDKIKKIENEN